MTTDPCKYCGNDHPPVGGVVCAYVAPFHLLAAGGAYHLIRVSQQHFTHEIQYDFAWQPPDVVRERVVHDLVRAARRYDNDRLRNLVHNNKKKHYYDTTTKTTQQHRHWKRPYTRRENEPSGHR